MKTNPFVSCSTLPRHALRYAYGLKTYSDDDQNRLRPCYNQNGRPLRQRSGFVTLSLHPLEDYGQVYDVVRLHRQGVIDVREHISPEREVKVDGFIERDRLEDVHIARYPSFERKSPTDNGYKSVYLILYGLDEELYSRFQELILRSAPHSEERRLVVDLLGEYLCYFHTHMLYVKISELCAQDRLQLFIDQYGKFAFDPPEDLSLRKGGDSELALRRRMMFQFIQTQQKPSKRSADVLMEKPPAGELAAADSADGLALPPKQKRPRLAIEAAVDSSSSSGSDDDSVSSASSIASITFG